MYVAHVLHIRMSFLAVQGYEGGALAHVTRAWCARADIVPQQVTIASLLQQVQREDALDLANGDPPAPGCLIIPEPIPEHKPSCVVCAGRGACDAARHNAL